MLDEKRWTWARPSGEDVKMENGYIFYSDLWMPYYPFDFPTLPNALVRVDSSKTLVDFAKKYGILGYQAFFIDRSVDVYTKGDPVEWFLAQAKTVKFALNLIKAIQEKDNDFIKSFIKDAAVTIPVKMFLKGASDQVKTLAHAFAIGPETVYMAYPGDQAIWEGKQRLLAMQIVNYLVNSNTEGVHRRLDLAGENILIKPYRFIPVFSARSLIEVIWHFVGEAALLSQGKSGKGIRTCEECGLPFIATDGRQKFCPGDAFSKGSLCGARYRMRKHRKK